MVEPVVPGRHQWLVGLLGARPGDRVADLGCGTGASLVQVAPDLGGGGVAVGVDASAAALARTADALAPTVAAGAAWVLLVQSDLKDPLPFRDAAFDRVLSQNVLEFVPDPVRLAAEAGRVLRPGGRLVLGHSDFDTLVFASENLQLTRRLVRAYCDAQQPWMDAVDGTIGRRLAAIAGRAGLEVLDVQAQVVLDRSFVPGGLAWGYAHNLAEALRAGGDADPGELDAWLAGLRRLDAQGASCSASTTTRPSVGSPGDSPTETAKVQRPSDR
jgi:SAM-dependent methyltransferase